MRTTGGRINGTSHRYGDAGAWGYRAHRIHEVDPPRDPDEVMSFLHVGHRYYDPAAGRFLQHDPTLLAHYSVEHQIHDLTQQSLSISGRRIHVRGSDG